MLSTRVISEHVFTAISQWPNNAGKKECIRYMILVVMYMPKITTFDIKFEEFMDKLIQT